MRKMGSMDEPTIRPIFDAEKCGQYGARIGVFLSHANWEGARNLLRVSQQELEASAPPVTLSCRRSLMELAEESAKETGRDFVFFGRACDPLELAGILELGDLVKTPLETVAKLPNVGPKILRYLTELAAIYGFTWPARDEEDWPLADFLDKSLALELQKVGFVTMRQLRIEQLLDDVLAGAGWTSFEIEFLMENLK